MSENSLTSFLGALVIRECLVQGFYRDRLLHSNVGHLPSGIEPHPRRKDAQSTSTIMNNKSIAHEALVLINMQVVDVANEGLTPQPDIDIGGEP
jgi:hypothetical protein